MNVDFMLVVFSIILWLEIKCFLYFKGVFYCGVVFKFYLILSLYFRMMLMVYFVFKFYYDI